MSVLRSLVCCRWVVLAALVRSSSLSILPGLSRDFSSRSSLFLAYLRSVPAASSPPLPLLSLSLPLSPPLSAHLSSSRLPGCLAPPPSYSLSPAFPPPAPPSSDFPPPPGFPPPFRFYLFGVGFFSCGTEVGVGVPPHSGVTTSTVNSAAMRLLLPLPPPRGLPLACLPFCTFESGCFSRSFDS